MNGKVHVFFLFLFPGWIFIHFRHPAFLFETLEISASGYGSDSRRQNMLNVSTVLKNIIEHFYSNSRREEKLTCDINFPVHFVWSLLFSVNWHIKGAFSAETK